MTLPVPDTPFAAVKNPAAWSRPLCLVLILISLCLGLGVRAEDEPASADAASTSSPAMQQLNAQLALLQKRQAVVEAQKDLAQAQVDKLVAGLPATESKGNAGTVTFGEKSGLVGKLVSHRALAEAGKAVGRQLQSLGAWSPSSTVMPVLDLAVASHYAELVVFRQRVEIFDTAATDLGAVNSDHRAKLTGAAQRVSELARDVAALRQTMGEGDPLPVSTLIGQFHGLSQQVAGIAKALPRAGPVSLQSSTGHAEPVAPAVVTALQPGGERVAPQSLAGLLTAAPLVLGAIDDVAAFFKVDTNITGIEVSAANEAFWASCMAQGPVPHFYLPGMRAITAQDSPLLDLIAAVSGAFRLAWSETGQLDAEVADLIRALAKQQADLTTMRSKHADLVKGVEALLQTVAAWPTDQVPASTRDPIAAGLRTLQAALGAAVPNLADTTKRAAAEAALLTLLQAKNQANQASATAAITEFSTYLAGRMAVPAGATESSMAAVLKTEGIAAAKVTHFLYLKTIEQGGESVVTKRTFLSPRIEYFGGAAVAWMLTDLQGRVVGSGTLDRLIGVRYRPGTADHAESFAGMAFEILR